MATTAGRDVENLTEAQALEVFDRMSRHYLGMSGREFVERWEAGEFRKEPENPGLMRVAMFLPLVR